MIKKLFLLILLLFIFAIIYAEDSMIISVEKTSIEIPIGWLAQYTKSPTLFILFSPLEQNDTFQENCNLVIEYLPSEYSIQEYKDASIFQIEGAFSDFLLLESTDNYHIYKGYAGETLVQQIQYIFIRNKIAYILTFTSNPKNFERYSGIFDKISNTFKY